MKIRSASMQVVLLIETDSAYKSRKNLPKEQLNPIESIQAHGLKQLFENGLSPRTESKSAIFALSFEVKR